MQNAGYEHFGFLLTISLGSYYIASRTSAKKKIYIYRLLCVQKKPLNFAYAHWAIYSIEPSAHSVIAVWFLGRPTEYVLKRPKALKYDILP